jgi:hypothetical protein
MVKVRGRRMRSLAGALVVVSFLVGAGALAPAAQAAGATPFLSTVTTTPIVTIPPDFMGISADLRDGGAYLSNRRFDSFLRLITPSGDHLTLRFGGTQADEAYWTDHEKEVKPQYRVAPAYTIHVGLHFLQLLAKTLRATGDKTLLNVNAAAHDPGMAASYIGAARRVLPKNSIMAAIIGDEPNLYDWNRSPIANGHSWVKSFGTTKYDTLYRNYAEAIKNTPIAGAETGSRKPTWPQALLRADRAHVAMITAHFYPWNSCYPKTSVWYPKLSDYLDTGLSEHIDRRVGVLMALARRYHVPLRLTELGSATCTGVLGINNRFITSLWAINQLFLLAREGVRSVNYQIKVNVPNTALQLLKGTLTARPVFYGLTLFSEAVANGAQLETQHGNLPDTLHLWSVKLRSGGWNFVLVNDSARAMSVRLRLPAHRPFTAFTSESLRSSSSTTATLGGARISPSGTLAAKWTPVATSNGGYVLTVPAQSAMLARAR